MDRLEYPNKLHSLPRSLVSFDEAASLCQAHGKRLCREDEWELACAGPEGRRYPYGNEREPWRCHTDGVAVGDPRGATPAGSHLGCATPEGVYDLNGNLSEWVDAGGVQPESWGVVRGGTMWPALYGQDCYSRHLHPKAEDGFADDGFRCCRDVKPVTATRAP
jgi:formylglycine-generating enzyme required for sulfatase activity